MIDCAEPRANIENSRTYDGNDALPSVTLLVHDLELHRQRKRFMAVDAALAVVVVALSATLISVLVSK